MSKFDETGIKLYNKIFIEIQYEGKLPLQLCMKLFCPCCGNKILYKKVDEGLMQEWEFTEKYFYCPLCYTKFEFSKYASGYKKHSDFDKEVFNQIRKYILEIDKGVNE